MFDFDDDRRRYEGDVFYTVWRSGRNPDAIDYNRVSDAYYRGMDSRHAAEREIRAQDEARRRRREEREMEEYYRYLAEQDAYSEQYGD